MLTPQNLKSLLVEFVAMTLFIYLTCGTVLGYVAPVSFDFARPEENDLSFQAHQDSMFGVMVPLAFGISIMILAYAAGRFNAGQLNPAVSLALFLTRKQGVLMTVLMMLVQILGSLTAVGLLAATIPNATDSSFGANSLAPGVSVINALVGETVMTFMLVIIVLVVAEASDLSTVAPIAIGLTVYMAHSLLVPIDGCSINPARSLGPAVASGTWNDFWVFVVGPLVGSLISVLAYYGLSWNSEPGSSQACSEANK